VTDTRAACVVRRDGEVLVEEHVAEEGRVYRPPSRSVRGDTDPEAAVRREFEDRLGVSLTDLSELGTFGDTRVFEGDIAAAWPYDETGFTVYDPETGETTRLAWLHLDDFRKYGEALRPEGLLAAL
jgi:predicted NUDIX family NTP pyrophosphohydrolase